MSVSRRKHFAVEKLRPEGQEAVRRGLEAGKTYEEIVSDVEATGEAISVSAVFNWARAVRVAQLEEERQSTLERTLEAIKAAPDARFVALVGNIVRDGLLGRREEIEKQDLPELLALLARFEKIQLAHKKVEADTIIAQAERVKALAAEKRAEAALQQADVAERKVKLLEDQVVAARKKLEKVAAEADGEGKVSVDAVRQVVADIYGIQLKAAAEEVPHDG